MAAQKPVKPVNPHHLTAKQLAADRANLAKARAVERVRPRTAKQKNASRHNLAKARAAQRARRSGKAPAAAKKPQAPLDSRETLTVPGLPTPEAISLGLSEGFNLAPADARQLRHMSHLYALPACAPVALAEHLAFWTGINPGVDDILALHAKSSGQLTLDGLLELVTAEGFAGMRLESFRRCDPDETVPGWIYGIDHPAGYHAVLAHPAGMVSWGSVLHRAGTPREAWHLEWAMGDTRKKRYWATHCRYCEAPLRRDGGCCMWYGEPHDLPYAERGL